MAMSAGKQAYAPIQDTAEASASPEVAALHARALSAERLASHQAVLISMLAELLATDSLEGALDALAGALKSRFDCSRVAIALIEKDELTLRAVSQQAVLEASSSEARLLVDAMHEACNQESTVCWPQRSNALGVFVAHRALVGRRIAGWWVLFYWSDAIKTRFPLGH